MSRRLIALYVSPWSERAKWALDHHRLEYQLIHHVPFLGEPRLRRLSQNKTRPTVPILVDGDRVLTESWDIARYADEIGAGSTLIPPELEAAIRAYQTTADAAMGTLRATVVAATLADDEALDASLPIRPPGPLAALIRPSTRWITRWFARKYALDLGAREAQLAVGRATLDGLRAALGPKPEYLLGGRFSYADILMAVLLQGILPVDDRFWRLPVATRRVWTRPELVPEYGDLFRWRDALYERHRRP
ncbi:MAG: glutathione S-transferase family protein [Myxococcota bacterium]